MLAKLTAYEWKKLFSGSFIKILLVVLLLINAVLSSIYALEQTRSDRNEEKQYFLGNAYALWQEDPEEFYREYERALSKQFDDVIPETLYGNENFFPWNIMEQVIATVEANDSYHGEMDRLISRAEMLMTNYRLDGKERSFNYRYQAQVVDIYSRLNEIVAIEPTEVVGWNEYFTYQNEFFLVFIMLTVLAVSMATGDRRCRAYPIISTYRFGRAHTVLAKSLAVSGASVMAVLLFTLTSLLSVWAACGLSTPHQAIQAVTGMTNYPAAISIGGAFLISLTVKLMAAILFAMLVFAFSALLKSALLGYASGIAVAVLQLLGSGLDVLVFGQWKYLNLWYLYVPNRFLVRYRSVGIFSRSVDLLGLFTVVFFLATVALAILSCYTYCRKGGSQRLGVDLRSLSEAIQSFGRKIAAAVGRLVPPRHLSLGRHELFKHRAFYLMMVVLVLLKLYTSDQYYVHDESAHDRAYQQYIEVVGGEYTPEKLTYLQEEYGRNAEIVGQMQEMERKFLSNEITADEYSRYYKKYAVAQLNQTVLKELIITASYLAPLSAKGVPVAFVNETGYATYGNQGVDWILVLFVALLACRFYLAEYENVSGSGGVAALVRTTPKGRGALLARKLILCLVTVFVVSVSFAVIDFLNLRANYTMPELSAPLISMLRYRNAPLMLTIGGYTVIAKVISVLGVCLLAVLCFFFGWLIKRAIYAYTAITALLLIPHFAARAGVDFASRLDLTMLQNTDSLFRYSLIQHRSAEWFVVFLSVVAALTVVIAVLCSVRIKKGGKA